MKKISILFVVLFVLFSCTEGTNDSKSSSSSNDKSEVEEGVVCGETLSVLPIQETVAMKFLRTFTIGRQAYAVYPAAVDPTKALNDYTYGDTVNSLFYAQNTHDYLTSVKYNEVETFDTIAEMAKKSVIVTPQVLTAKFRVTLTHYSENSNALQVYVRAKGSSDEWKVITLNGVGTDYCYVETNASGELEYYVVESSYYDWIDDEHANPGVHIYGYVKANLKVDGVYLPFK